MHTCNVFTLADYLAEKFACKFVIILGCGSSTKLNDLYAKYKLIGFDQNENNLLSCTQNFPEGNWVQHDWESGNPMHIPNEILSQALVLCTDVILRMKNPYHLLFNLKEMMNHAKVGILSASATKDINSHLEKLKQVIKPVQFNVEFTGCTPDSDNNKLLKFLRSKLQDAIVILGHNQWNRKATPRDNKVIAIMPVYNEEDIVYHSIKKLVEQQIHVYIIDNWSSDASLDEINKFKGHPYFLGVEQFPAEGPSPYYQWTEILKNVERVAQELDGDWFILHDADEIRESPWEDLNLKEAINHVDQMGFNTVNFTVVNFHPVDNGFQSGEFEAYFKYFDFGREDFYFFQTKMWKRIGNQEINLHASGGHTVQFVGSTVCPYKFLTKHYSLRSQQHANRKIFRDRKSRWDPEERKRGMHIHYDHIAEGDSILRNPKELNRFEKNCKNSFYQQYLFQRIAGLGIS